MTNGTNAANLHALVCALVKTVALASAVNFRRTVVDS